MDEIYRWPFTYFAEYTYTIRAVVEGYRSSISQYSTNLDE